MAVISFEGTSRNDRTNAFEMLILPLDGGHANPRCLGIMSTGHKPFWLGADPIVKADIESLRVLDPDREMQLLKSRQEIDVPALSPTELLPAGDRRQPGGSRRIRHLVVLDGGRE